MNTINLFSGIPYHVSRVKEESTDPIIEEGFVPASQIEKIEKIFEKQVDLVEDYVPPANIPSFEEVVTKKVEEEIVVQSEPVVGTVEEKSVNTESKPDSIIEVKLPEIAESEEKPIEVIAPIVEEKPVEEVVSTKKKKK